MDWVPSRHDYPEGLVVIYDGGEFSDSDIAAIAVPTDELNGFEFVPPGEVAARVSPIVGRRIRACLEALAVGTVAALDNGRPVS